MAILWSLAVLATAAATPATVAVTGATGKLGRHAVEQLVAAGQRVGISGGDVWWRSFP